MTAESGKSSKKSDAKGRKSGDGGAADKQHGERRSFMVKFAAGAIGALVGLVPLAVGLVAYLNPLRSTKGSADDAEDADFVRITTLASVPTDGRPYRFPVVKQRTDAWNVYPDSRVGSIYLRRTPDGETPEAFTATCPHLGCMVDYKPADNVFLCPCHNSSWFVDGQRTNPDTSPSPRDLDTLEVEVRNGDEIWVNYQQFRGGIEAKEVV